MDAETMRTFLLTLPHVAEAEQWGGLLFWVGDKAIGGKTFAMVNLEAAAGHPISFAAAPERFAELCERDGMIPAPYSARHFWVAAERWDALRDAEWREQLLGAQALTYGRLPAKTQTILDLPKVQREKAIAERKRVLAGRAGAKAASGKRLRAPRRTGRES